MKSTLKRLDAVHERLGNTVNAVDPALLSRRPAENEWSVAEVIEHLCLVEGAVMGYLESKLEKPPDKVGFLAKLKPMRIVSLRFKRLQAPERVRPSENLPPMAELLEKYDQLREKTKKICNEAGAGTSRPDSFQTSLLWRHGRRRRGFNGRLSRTTPLKTDSRDT
jgi:hypothetical protein